ncbi:hypothetical protein [Mesorhizobium sp.]|uniref:hypothetical protein n=1 Tax=Mesorhizobium sp. TaxID=1871066 RepID=UPI0033901FB6
MLRMIVCFALLCGLVLSPTPAAAQKDQPIRMASGVQYQFLESWDVDRLNKILQTDAPEFFGLLVTYSPARNAVRLYRVTYSSVILERGNKPLVATALVAIPETSETAFPVNFLPAWDSLRKTRGASFPEQSPETELMIAQFAG